MSRLIFYRCEKCGLLHKIYINKNKVRISVLDKLYSEVQIFDSNGYLICIECKHENKLQIQIVFP